MQDRPPLVAKRRTFVVFLAVGLFDIVLMGRLVSIQALGAERLKRIADDIHYRGIPLAPYRGNIVDREGKLLAASHHVYSVYAIPVQARPHRLTSSSLLSRILKMSDSTVVKRLARRIGFVWIKRNISKDEYQEIQRVLPKLPGIYVLSEMTRDYPEGALAGPVLGFTGIDNQGLAGLELIYDKILAGKPGSIEELYDVTGNEPQLGTARVIPGKPGDMLKLSLDHNIQWMAEQACEHGLAQTGGKSVSVLVMHPATGGILALAQRPSFDPNHYREYDPKRYRELAISDAIPPGSIFKPVTLASALDSGSATPDSGYYCPGFKVVLGRRVNCWRPGGHGPESLGDVVQNSCNVGFMELGLGLGKERFYDYLKKFGLTGITHIDLPGEARGIIPNIGRATALDLAVMAFGQTLTVTPIGLLNAVSAIANGGELLRPHVAKEILSPDGKTVIKQFDRDVVRRVVSPEVSRVVQQMMTRVVELGTGKNAQVPGYRVAGKTGTAQKVVNGRVEHGIYIASFIGFAPVPNPSVAMLVSVDEPQGAYFGGQVSAPIFGRVMREILRYLKIPATVPIKRPKPGVPAMVPDLVDLDPATALIDAGNFGFRLRFAGKGDLVVGQSIEYGAWRPAGEVITCTLGDKPRLYMEWVTVPNFIGLSQKAARHLAWDLGLNVHWQGDPNGTAQRQGTAPGTQVHGGTTILVLTDGRA